MLPPPPDSLRDAYDPERFRADGHRLVDRLADWLAQTTGRDEAPVLPWIDPSAVRAGWPAEFPEQPGADLVDTLGRVIDGSIRLHHPRYLGHQVPPPIPGAALADLVAALLNNGGAVYEMGPASTPQELAVISWMAAQLGMPADAGGILTSGGSLGNLTALLAARLARAGFDAWTAGDRGGPPLAVLCSSQAHYSLARAVRIMGWGDDGAIPVDVDDRFRLDLAALPAAFDRAVALGRRPIAVVASAASTGTGAYDPLPAIADFCAARGLWLHVDGAHGASTALSPRHRHLVAGIDRADSGVWDAHKMMAMPALITAVVFRDGRRSYEAFAQEASYLFAAGRGEGHAEWFNLGLRTLECTKRMMATIVHTALTTCCVATFRAYVDRCFAHGAALAAHIDAAPDFELTVPPDGNIVCWRYRPAGADPARLDELQGAVRRRVLERGRYYILQTRLASRLVLRAALMNPLTEDVDLLGMLDEVRHAGAEVLPL
jgi:L-2,4-diaminobutyrate decarboxylase